MTKQAPSLRNLLDEFESVVRMEEMAGVLPPANASAVRKTYLASKVKFHAAIEALESRAQGTGLRDQFAGQAIMPLTIILTRNGTALDVAEVAKQAYAMADAMLTARAS